MKRLPGAAYRLAGGLALGAALLALYAPFPLSAQDSLVTQGLTELYGDACTAGDCLTARSLFEEALDQLPDQDPGRAEVLAYLIQATVQGSEGDLARPLWLYFAEGRSVETLDLALDALVHPQDRFADEAEDLLTLIAMSLSMQSYEPSEFPQEAIAERFSAIATRPDIGAGVEELLRWHRDRNVWGPPTRGTLTGCSATELTRVRTGGNEAWQWWGDPAGNRSTRVGITRHEAGRALIAQLGQWYLHQANLGEAEAFLCISAFLVEDDIMTAAYRDLVWTYVDMDSDDSGLLIKTMEDANKDHVNDDHEYLRPIEEAFYPHPWSKKPLLLLPLVCFLVDCWPFGDDGAPGQITVTIP